MPRINRSEGRRQTPVARCNPPKSNTAITTLVQDVRVSNITSLGHVWHCEHLQQSLQFNARTCPSNISLRCCKMITTRTEGLRATFIPSDYLITSGSCSIFALAQLAYIVVLITFSHG